MDHGHSRWDNASEIFFHKFVNELIKHTTFKSIIFDFQTQLSLYSLFSLKLFIKNLKYKIYVEKLSMGYLIQFYVILNIS